jgi:putative ABC transport system permease protein
MRIFAILRISLRALKRNLLRTLLTMLGIIIGVAAVIAMVSIGNGAKAQIEAQIASLGQNIVIVLSGNFRRGGVSMGFGSAGTLTVDDLRAIEREVPGVVAITPEVRAMRRLPWEIKILTPQLSVWPHPIRTCGRGLSPVAARSVIRM